MYGTRGAAVGWQEECKTIILSFGFHLGVCCPNGHRNFEQQIQPSVNGSDFTSDGGKLALDWFESEVARKYEITISFGVQSPIAKGENVDVHTDTDWARCLKTRESTSGGCELL